MDEQIVSVKLTATPSEPMPINEDNNITVRAACNCGADVFAWKASDAVVRMYEQPASVSLTSGKPGVYRITALDSRKHEGFVDVEFFGFS